VHARAIGKFFARTFQHFLEFLLGFGEFLLVEKGKRFVVELQLRLHAWVNQFHAAALRRVL
jgi:hypothetical protein